MSDAHIHFVIALRLPVRCSHFQSLIIVGVVMQSQPHLCACTLNYSQSLGICLPKRTKSLG